MATVSSGSSVGAGPRSVIATWLYHHRQAALTSCEKLFAESVASFLTIMVIGIALALPNLGFSLATTLQDQIAKLNAPPQLSILMEPQITFNETAQLRERLMRRPGIAQVELIDRDDALADFTASAGLEALLERLGTNPLPHSLWVYPKANVRDAGLDQLRIDLSALPGVSNVILDSRWLTRLNSFSELMKTTAVVLFFVMAAGVVLTLGNTLRLAIEARREEIIVIKLIGGGDAFARRPFLYTGLLTGCLGGLMAGLLSFAAAMVLKSPINRLLELYDQPEVMLSLAISDLLVLIGIGSTLGLMSAWYSVQLHLARIKPR